MPQVRLAILIVCLMASAVAHAADGSVYLYLQPLAQDAAPLTFTVASISAIDGSGAEHPLTLNLKTVRSTEVARQRLFASGRLPAGAYSGFSLRVKQAVLKGDEGETTLAVPDLPTRLDLPFSIGGQEAPLFWLTFRFQESVGGGVTFTPVFSGATAARPIVRHSGFVTNTRANTITVFDKQVGQAVAAIETCGGPAGMALDQRRQRLYVACSRGDEVQSIDISTGKILDRSRVSPGDRPRELALTPDGLTLIAVNGGSNSISFFDATSVARQERVNVGNGPTSLAIDPAGRRAFVFNTLSNSISVVDIAGRSQIATVSTDSAPVRGQFNTRGDRLFVIHERSPYMTVLDAAQLSVTTRARLRTGASAIKVDPVRGLVCIGAENDPAIEFYDPNALMPLYSMRIRGGASFLTIDGEDNRLYAVSPETRSVIVGRLTDRKVASEIDVGDGAYSVAVMGER